MNVEKALDASPVKQAIRDDGNGLQIVVTELESGAYEIIVTAGATVYLTEIVQDVQTIEQVLWERLRMHGILFEPAHSRLPPISTTAIEAKQKRKYPSLKRWRDRSWLVQWLLAFLRHNNSTDRL